MWSKLNLVLYILKWNKIEHWWIEAIHSLMVFENRAENKNLWGAHIEKKIAKHRNSLLVQASDVWF